MEFSERLDAAMKHAQMTQGKLAKAVGMAQSSVNKLLNGASSSRKTVEIARALGVRPEWLSSGQGPMLPDGSTLPSPNYSTIQDSKFRVSVWDDAEDVSKTDYVEVPLLNVSLSAGPGCCEVEESTDFSLIFRKDYLRKVGVKESAAKLVRVTGRSMEPTLNDGDIVGVNMDDIEIRDGKTYAICQADLMRVKILIARPDVVIIRSLNRDEYPDEVIPRDQFHDQVRVIGKVFWSAHNW